MWVYVRPSNEALLRARVPGAQDQRGYPSHLFHRARSASKKDASPLPVSLSLLLFPYFTFRPFPEPDDIILVLDPDQRTDDQRKDKKLLPLFIHNRHNREASEGRQRATGGVAPDRDGPKPDQQQEESDGGG